MQLTISSVDYAPADLNDQLPIVIDLIRQMPGEDRNDYWLAKPQKPITWISGGGVHTIMYVVVASRWQGTEIKPGVDRLPIGIAYVTDSGLVNDERVDFEKCAYVAVGISSETSDESTPRHVAQTASGIIAPAFGLGSASNSEAQIGARIAAPTEPIVFRDLSTLTSMLKISLVVYMMISVVAIWSGWLQIDIIQRASDGQLFDMSEADSNDARQGLIGIAQIVITIITGLLFLRWVFLTKRNTRALNPTGSMEYTPGWAVGWFFVPFATLWKPYYAMKENFMASHPDYAHDWHLAPTPSFLPVWWALWVISSVLGQAVFRMSMRAESLDELNRSAWMMFASDLIDLPLGIVAIMIVGMLHTWQTQKNDRREAVLLDQLVTS